MAGMAPIAARRQERQPRSRHHPRAPRTAPMIVIDASAAVDLLIGSAEKLEWLDQRLQSEHDLQVPAVFDIEVLHSLRRLEASQAVAAPVLAVALQGYPALRISRHDHVQLRSRIWELRHNLSAYDAAYVALAEALAAPLITTDMRLAGSSGHDAAIEAPPV